MTEKPIIATWRPYMQHTFDSGLCRPCPQLNQQQPIAKHILQRLNPNNILSKKYNGKYFGLNGSHFVYVSMSQILLEQNNAMLGVVHTTPLPIKFRQIFRLRPVRIYSDCQNISAALDHHDRKHRPRVFTVGVLGEATWQSIWLEPITYRFISRTKQKHVDVIKWNHFPRYWHFLRGIHRSPVNSPHKGQWRGALMFTLICARIDG